MKYRLLFIAACLLTVTAAAQRPGSYQDALHYAVALTLNDSTDMIKGEATVTLKLQRNDTIRIDLINKKSDGKGMIVTGVKEDQESIAFKHEQDVLYVYPLAAEGEGSLERSISISYEGIPADGLIISNNKYKRRGFFGDNWPNRARNWFPCIDHPADKASIEFIVTAPDHYKVVANGFRVTERPLQASQKLTHYKMSTPISTKIMVIGVSDFEVEYVGDVHNAQVYSWVFPEDKEKGFYDYAQAMEILPYFIEHVGPYAFAQLYNVQSKTIFGGMENAGAIFYSENSVTGTRKSESLLAHEIAHQWFGDMATESDWPHLWLSEGFATYFTLLYFENKYGQDTVRKMREEDRLQVIGFNRQQSKPVVDTTVTNYMELLNANSYQKGGWVLHMLRKKLGDSIFWAGIRSYYSRYAGKNASTIDFQRVMEEFHGKSLNTFFQQWLYTAGHPVLDIKWKYNAAKKETEITVQQQQKQLFEFPLEFDLKTKDGRTQRITFGIKQKINQFKVPTQSPALHLAADPDVNLLFERAAGQ